MTNLDCICGRCASENHYFVCAQCGRTTPWCRGADDEHSDLCDDCAVEKYCYCCGRGDRTLAPCPWCGKLLCQECEADEAHTCELESEDMVTISLSQLLDQKRQYALQWPGGKDTMPYDVQRAYDNLLTEIKTAGKRSQIALPGLGSLPPPMAKQQPGLL